MSQHKVTAFYFQLQKKSSLDEQRKVVLIKAPKPAK